MIYKVNYTDDIPEGKAGVAKFWFIKIRPSRMYDYGLLAHELEHVKQFWMFTLFHLFAYGRINKYTLWCEIKAYKKQLEYNPDKKELYAKFISKNYNLDISEKEALRLLNGY